MKKTVVNIIILLIVSVICQAQDLTGDISEEASIIEDSTSVVEDTYLIIDETTDLIEEKTLSEKESDRIVELTFKERAEYLKRTVLIEKFEGGRRSYQSGFRSILASKLEDSGLFHSIVADGNGESIPDMQRERVPDILIKGQLVEVGSEITFKIVVTDRLFERNIFKEKYRLGGDVISGIDRITVKLSQLLSAYYSAYKNELIDRVDSLQYSSDGAKKRMALQLLNQKEVFLDYSMKSSKQNKVIPLIFSQSAVIFTAEAEAVYKVYYGEQEYSSKDGIVVLSFANEKREDMQFIIKKEGENDIVFNYRQKQRYQVVVENLIFFNSKIIKSSRFYLDLNFVVTTKFSIGGDIKFGIGLVKDARLENNLYVRSQLTYRPMDKFGYFRLKFGVGYQHIFFIKNIVGFMPGVEVGFEFYLLKAVKVLNTIFYFDGRYIFGMPSLYISIPLLFEFPSNLKYSLIFGIEPIFRFIPKMMVYDGYAWLEDYYINFVYPSYMRINLPIRENSSNMAFDTLFYDMPIILGLRIKL